MSPERRSIESPFFLVLKSYSACGVGYGHNRGAGKIFLKVRVSTFMEMIDPGFLVSKD
ncbi:hypothetical protein [Leptospira interrogans]|uniref:hypothetical protein n=1 Tax=Leptospira interrogans TaxID=173 RepID=UPI000291DC73|nr:hypothetical protein [Leptospira interrogans]EKO06149.1 hypothetical protein LEP1GSC077_2275 [Leptospira interrogans str. C10069]